ncbi:unnamed protein product [Rhizophagus irregularis]|nr:unnamed protein product [Rhizophagus irregularis]
MDDNIIEKLYPFYQKFASVLFELQEEDKENKETFLTQQRKTKRTRRQICTYKENAKDNGITRIMKNNLGPSVPNVNLPASYNINFDLNPSFNSQPTLQPSLYNIPYYTNINTSLPISIYSQYTFSSTNAIPNSNYTSFNIPQDQLAYSYPSIPNDLGQFSYNNQIELTNSYSYSFNQAPDNNFSDNNTFSQEHF